MNLEIKQIRPALSEEWDSVWQQCTYATYFHSREWAEIWSNYHKGTMRPNPLSLLFSDGKKALLPLSYTISSENADKIYLSSPEGTYGGWIAVDPIGWEHAVLMKEFLTKDLGHLFWQTNPYDDLINSSGVDTNIEDETHTINLEIGFDAVYKNWAAACQRAERKARKSGVIAKIADTENDWLNYYQAYKDSLRRWGDQALSRYKWTLFQEMFDRKSDHIKLWLVTKDELVIAGALMCYAMSHVVYWHGAALKDYFVLRPMNLLFYEIIKDACDKRYRWFDFNSSAGLEGVRRFKESFGAKPLDCSEIIIRVKAPDS